MSNSTAITIKDKVTELRAQLDKRQLQIAAALPPNGLTPARFAQITVQLCAKTPQLLDCTPGSLVGCVMQAAQLGLSVDPVLGEAWILPYKVKGTPIAQFITGYKGLIKLAWQSDRLAKINARVVHDGDFFQVAYGLDEKLEHIPQAEHGAALTHVYAIARTKDSKEPVWELMPKAEVEAIKARSRGASSGYSPWTTDYEAMAKKTVLRRLCKLLPSSTTDQRLARAVVLDEQAELGLKQDLHHLLEEDAGDTTDEHQKLLDEMPAPQTKE